MNKFEKLAWDIFQGNLIEDKLKAFFDKWKKPNERIGSMVYEFFTGRDHKATKTDYIFQPKDLRRVK